MGSLSRTFTRCAGYWPNASLNEQARNAWRHLLADTPEASILDALDDYAAEGHTRPPVAGQLAARIDTAKTEREPEIDRARRQRKYAERCVKERRMPKADFDYYDRRYWQPVFAGTLHATPLKGTPQK